MPEIFINYRTSDGKDAAYALYHELTRRFGDRMVFLAAQSIPAGENYNDALTKGVRRSSILLALIGHGWTDTVHPARPGTRALDHEDDWVRREIEEAFAHGVAVLPVLIGRHTEQLDPRRLPESIVALADCQYMRFTLRTAGHDLALIGDQLAKQVPELAAADRGPDPAVTAAAPPAEQGPGADDTAPGMHNTGQSGGIGNVSGRIGTVVGEANAPFHSGSGDLVSGDRVDGDQINGPQVTGDGNIVGGGDHGGIDQNFGPARRRRENDR
ncbi:toll/interleukin-1 receptor domain-containing protein [Streptomyces sp. NPDC004134]|uniref:toll/interleukin-1 receptor domain-containing protein n=1 Tax=Streptomyces sp. NPDC004134 TaxID=3364691 RepID=UPI0036C2898C